MGVWGQGSGGASCRDIPSCPQPGSISVLAFCRRLLRNTLPTLRSTSRTRVLRRRGSHALCPHTALVQSWSPWDAQVTVPHARAAVAPARSPRSTRSAVGMDQEEEAATQQQPHRHCSGCSPLAMCAAHLLLSQQSIEPFPPRAGHTEVSYSRHPSTPKCVSMVLTNGYWQ